MVKKLEKLLQKWYIPYCAIAILAIIIYYNSISAPFTLDDFGSIVNNYSIRNPLDILAMWKFYSNRFIVYFTFSINYYFHVTAVEGYHITNIILHILNGMLIFAIFYNILGLRHFTATVVGRYRSTVSLLSALVFVCHPVQVNAVTYLVQRTAALASMFYFLAILFFLKFRIHGKLRYFFPILLFTIFAMFTKENTITIPFMLLIIELIFFLKDGKTSWVKRIAFLLVLFMLVPIIPATNLYLSGHSQSDPGVSFKASTDMDRFVYFYTELNVIMLYIRQLFIPDHLNFDYSNDFPMSHKIWENHSYVALIFLALVGLIGLFTARRNKMMSLGILWFFLGLSVESSFISIKDVYFEHRLYFPVVGFVMFIVGLVFYRFKRPDRLYLFRKPMLFFVIVAVFMIGFYSAVTIQRNYIFSDGIRLWSDVVKKAPKSDRAHCVLATNLLDAYELNNKRKDYLDRSEEEFKKAIELNRYNSTAHCNLSKVYLYKEDYEKCIFEADLTNGLAKSTYAYNNLASAYLKLGKTNEAIKALLDGYNLDKQCTFILKGLGNAYYDIEDYDNAKKYYKEFLKFNKYSDSKVIQKKLDDMEKSST